MNNIIIGVDFDNTIVSYDALFYRLAREKKLIPSHIRKTKNDVRDYLRCLGKENDWIELQGIAYTTRIAEAPPLKGALAFFKHCMDNSAKAYIISHKTRYPFIGENHDLHQYARHWLNHYDFYEKTGLSEIDVFFELTKEDKIKRIITAGCTHFIDDLPELFTANGIPGNITKILFDPSGNLQKVRGVEHKTSWGEILEFFKTKVSTS